MGEGLRDSHTVTSMLYRRVLDGHRERLEELRDPRILYVTDLVSCSHKRRMRLEYPELTLKFEPQLVLGDLLHEGLERILEEQGYRREVEVVAEYEVLGTRVTLKGRVDAVGDDAVVEIKTGRSGQSLPHDHHILQLQVYLNLLGMDRGILVYITPDRMAEYEVDRDPIDIKMLVEETLLDVKHPRWHWECRYCVFSKMCPHRVEQ